MKVSASYLLISGDELCKPVAYLMELRVGDMGTTLISAAGSSLSNTAVSIVGRPPLYWIFRLLPPPQKETKEYFTRNF